MPLIIGNLDARIAVSEEISRDHGGPDPVDVRDRFLEQMRRDSARRFEEERKIQQRDPDLLGGE